MIVFKVLDSDVKQDTDELMMHFEGMPLRQDVKIAATAMFVKEYIESKLANLFPDRQHFFVAVDMVSGGVYQIEVTADEIGTYYYHGTQPHAIASSGPMPVGNGQFAMSVQHPGTAPHANEIDEIVLQAMMAAIMGNSGWAF